MLQPRFVRRIAVEFLRDNLFKKYFSVVLTRCCRYAYVYVCIYHMYISKNMYVCVVYVEAYAAKMLQMRQETARARTYGDFSTIFPRIYVDYPAFHELLFLSRYTSR